jgi:GT2 family glycosyltransferase
VDLSIIIINWNSPDFVRKCLASIFTNTEGFSFEVIVVDNGSFDGCGKMIERDFPQVKFVQSEENIGFARSNNLAFHHSTGDYLLFLNPDTEVVGPAIRILFEQVRSLPRAGAVGCKLLNSDRSLQTSCIQSFPTIINQILDSESLRQAFPKSALWGMAPLYSGVDRPLEAEAISGACIMMKREVFEAAGHFSTDYFMYAEDIDLCYKTKRKDYINYFVSNANIIHHGDGSVRKAKTNFATVMAVESLWRFFKKHRGSWYAFAYRQAILVAALGRLAVLGGTRLLPRKRSGRAEPRGSVVKWWAILRWAAGLERWALQYR